MTLHFPTHSVDPRNDRRSVAAALPRKRSADRNTFYTGLGKRLFETTLVLLSLPLALPLVALCAALIAMDGRNPFYSQMRVGRDGRHFRMWKLRTMVYRADALLNAYLATDVRAQQEWDSTQKLKHDPRITFIGRYMRKTSLDELPQLLNVLNGTMSLVGPRPMLIEQQDSYPGNAYFKLRPGITGLWQVSDRNDCEFRGRARYDDDYYETVSLKTDIQIIARTVTVVLKATGH